MSLTSPPNSLVGLSPPCTVAAKPLRHPEGQPRLSCPPCPPEEGLPAAKPLRHPDGWPHFSAECPTLSLSKGPARRRWARPEFTEGWGTESIAPLALIARHRCPVIPNQVAALRERG